MTGWGKRKDGQAYPKDSSKKGIKSSITKPVSDIHLKEKPKIFEIELLTKGTNEVRGYKFVEGFSPKEIRKNKDEHVGEGVEIGEINLMPYHSLDEAQDRYNEEHGIEVVDGVRYYKDHKDCIMCQEHFNKK